MKGKVFIDTNLLIYFVSDDLARKQKVHELLHRNQSVTETDCLLPEP